LNLGDVGDVPFYGVDGFVNQVPVVVDEGALLASLPFPQFDGQRRRRRGRDVEPLHGLRYPAAAVVVCIADADRAVGEGSRGHGCQLVFGVVGIGPGAVGGKTSVGVVVNRPRRRRGAVRSGNLVEIVVRIRVCHGVVAEEQMAADVVVGVCKLVRADGGGEDLAAVVVGERGYNGRDARCPSSTRHRARERVKGIAVGIDRGGIEVGCAVRHKVAAEIVAINDATDGVAGRRCKRIAVVVAGVVRVGDGEGASCRVRGGDARDVSH